MHPVFKAQGGGHITYIKEVYMKSVFINSRFFQKIAFELIKETKNATKMRIYK